MTERLFTDHRAAALALLNGNYRITRAAGQFLGQCVVDPSPLSEKQAVWMAQLLSGARLPALAEGDVQ